MNSASHIRPRRTASSLLVDVAELAFRARAIVRRVRRRTRHLRASERPPARLPGAAARLLRPLEVAVYEVGDPPTYSLGGGLVRIYGLGPPRLRADRWTDGPPRRPEFEDADEPLGGVDDAEPPPEGADAPFEAEACWDVPER
jgi:hypothetical protein